MAVGPRGLVLVASGALSPPFLVLGGRLLRGEHVAAGGAEQVSLAICVQHRDAFGDFARRWWPAFIHPPDFLVLAEAQRPVSAHAPARDDVPVPLGVAADE